MGSKLYRCVCDGLALDWKEEYISMFWHFFLPLNTCALILIEKNKGDLPGMIFQP